MSTPVFPGAPQPTTDPRVKDMTVATPGRPGPAQPAPVTGPGPSSWPKPTIPGFGAPTVPGSVSHAPASTAPSWQPNQPSGPFPAPGAAEAGSAQRGQQVIDRFKDVGRVDVTPRHTDAWPLKR